MSSRNPRERNSRKRHTRTRLVGVAATAVLGGTLLVPAAHAYSSGAPLTVAVSDVTHHTLTRGSGTNSFTVTVANTSDAVQQFTGDAMVWPGTTGGPSPVEVGQVRTAVTPVQAPATDLSVQGQNPGLNALFYPHGGTAASGFRIPAGARYSWKVTVGAAADFPGNDDGLDIDVTASVGRVVAPGHVHFDIAPALPDGRLTEKFDRVVTVAPGTPGTTTLKLYDGAGGTFTSPLTAMVGLDSPVPGLNLDYRSGDAWLPAKATVSGGTWLIPPVPAGFSYQQTHSYTLRFTLGRRPAAPRDLSLQARVVLGGTIASARTTLHLKQPPAPSPTSTSTSAPAPAVAAATTHSHAATSGGSTPTTQLAHTGSSHTALIAALAALLTAAGALLILTTTRRRTT
ncbi:hypothetical protein AB0M29_38230 [Streptomyces sp. NPDC051976]|uniref:hypothetical protein n=1 Tax=Streptomyces sp. NPDC051976 TaxID=3154947 RepID=UPI00343C4B5A